MAKSIHPDVLDAALEHMRTSCTSMVACLSEPANYLEASGALALASTAMVSADFGLAAGDISGRKCVVGPKGAATVSTSGVATHVALLDETSERLLYVTTCPDFPLTQGSQVSFSAWDIEFADPS